jgi:hypothetical protein
MRITGCEVCHCPRLKLLRITKERSSTLTAGGAHFWFTVHERRSRVALPLHGDLVDRELMQGTASFAAVGRIICVLISEYDVLSCALYRNEIP